MGAQPAWCTLSLSLPAADADWVDRFLDGFLELASQHDVALVGGDTTRGPLSIGVTVHGFVETGRALRRGAAQVGDEVWVSGTLGDAAAALRLLLPPSATILARTEPPAVVLHALRLRLDRPTPRVAIGLTLVGVAHAAIDVSDGLLADLAHVCRASAVAAELQLEALPMSSALRDAFAPAQRHALQAAGGDDYELCFTAAATSRAAIEGIARDTGVALTRIGAIVAGQGVRVFDDRGHHWQPTRSGYVHFAD
jgi:thiamine-monophosphate kinase